MKKLLLLILGTLFIFSCSKDLEYIYVDNTETLSRLKIIVEEYYSENIIRNIYVRLYPSFINWENETGLVREGYTDYNGEIIFDYLYPGDYYLDIWGGYYDNWDLAYENISFIKVIVEENTLKEYVNYVDYTRLKTTKFKDKVKLTSFQGTITDKITGESLVGVLVKLNNQDKEVYTDLDGNFYFSNIIPGKYQISISYISYQEITKNIIIR